MFTSRFIRAFLSRINKFYDYKKLRASIENTGNPVAKMIFSAWDKTKTNISHKRYLLDGEIIVSYVVWKVLLDTAYRGAFIRFLINLAETLDIDELKKYDKEPRNWYVNRSVRFRNGRKKFRKLQEEK